MGNAVLTGVTLGTVEAARERIRPYLLETPSLEHTALSERLGVRTVVKLELLQRCGMFKVRGAFNRLLTLAPDDLARGVVAVSGGNHAIAVAYAARTLGVDATVVMPENTPEHYARATRAQGATLLLVGDVHEAFALGQEMTRAGRTLVHPFDDPEVIAGQGTLALELLEQAPDLTDVIVSIGGGGLVAGIATVVKALRPDARIWGVETEGAEAMTRAIAAGRPVPVRITSIAKTLGAPAVSERTLRAAASIEEVVLVSDADAVRAQKILLEDVKVLAEPAASCVLAAAERLRPRFAPDAVVALVLCGGNTTLQDVVRWQSEFNID